MPLLHGLARLGHSAEVRYTPKGEAVCNLSLAFTYGTKGEDGKRPTQWVDASLWGKRAEVLAEYLTRGTAVAVTLSDVHLERFTKRDGTPDSKLVGRVVELELAGTRAQGDGEGQPAARPAAAPPPQTHGQMKRAGAQAATGTGFDDMDQDIPFIVNTLVCEPQPGKSRRLARTRF